MNRQERITMLEDIVFAINKHSEYELLVNGRRQFWLVSEGGYSLSLKHKDAIGGIVKAEVILNNNINIPMVVDRYHPGNFLVTSAGDTFKLNEEGGLLALIGALEKFYVTYCNGKATLAELLAM